MNPLADLVSTLGLTENALLDLSGENVKTIRSALAVSPTCPAHAYLNLMGCLGAFVRVKAEPLSFWLDLDFVDNLWTDDVFRKSIGLPPNPPDLLSLRQMVTRWKRREGQLQRTADKMKDFYIPSWKGNLVWTRISVSKFTQRGRDPEPGVTRDTPIGQDFIDAWRIHVLDGVFATCVDPGWSIRYGLERKIGGGKLICTTTRKMPTAVRNWVFAGLGSIPWLRGQWGEMSAPEQTHG